MSFGHCNFKPENQTGTLPSHEVNARSVRINSMLHAHSGERSVSCPSQRFQPATWRHKSRGDSDVQAPVSHTVEFSAKLHRHLEVLMGILSLPLQCKDTVARQQGPQPGAGGCRHCLRTASLMHKWQRSRLETGLECMWGSPRLQFVGPPWECCTFQSMEVLFTSRVRSESLPAGLCYHGVQPWHLRL